MQTLQRLTVLVVAAFVCAFALTTVARTQTTGAASVKQIDTECNAIQDAVMALHPVHVAYRSSSWAVLSDADYAAAEQTKASVTFADVYKQGAKYAWVHAHSFNEQGTQRATQLCFRQSDGTLERARQAATVPDLASAAAEQAYFSPDGKVIQSTKLFEMNDPMVAKTIEALPFYSVLPK
jgi:ligand-binding SRPBCC domain-containing protein